jgi:hypothetical protein
MLDRLLGGIEFNEFEETFFPSTRNIAGGHDKELFNSQVSLG